MNNIFMQVHRTRDGKEQPIVTMGDEHLVNMIRFMLIKLPEESIEAERSRLLGNYAPPDMSKKQRRALNMPEATEQTLKDIETELSLIEQDVFQRALQKAVPYIVVGIARDTTHLEVREILVEATGLTQRVDMPEMITYPVMDANEVELLGLNDGIEDTFDEELRDHTRFGRHPDWLD